MRDYKKEMEWKKKRYDEIRANIDIDIGSKLRSYLKKQNKTIAGWVTEKAKEEVEKNEII